MKIIEIRVVYITLISSLQFGEIPTERYFDKEKSVDRIIMNKNNFNYGYRVG